MTYGYRKSGPMLAADNLKFSKIVKAAFAAKGLPPPLNAGPSSNQRQDCDENIGNCPGWQPDGTANWADWRWNDTVAFVEDAAASGSLDVVSWHWYSYYGCRNGTDQYSCTPGLPLAKDALTTPSFLDRTGERAGRYASLQQAAAPRAQNWLTATASGGLGGIVNVSDAFASTLWMLDSLGMLAAKQTHLVFRDEIFCGNNVAWNTNGKTLWHYAPYCIIRVEDDQRLTVKPDYFAILLFKKLVGVDALPATVEPSQAFGESKLRAYSFKSKKSALAGLDVGESKQEGGVVTVLINLGAHAINTTVTVGGGGGGGGIGGSNNSKMGGSGEGGSSDLNQRLVWHLAGVGGSDTTAALESSRVKINGNLMPNDGELPSEKEIAGVKTNCTAAVLLKPYSAAFIVDV